MEHKVEKEMAKEKILEVKPAPGDAEVKVSIYKSNCVHSSEIRYAIILCQ